MATKIIIDLSKSTDEEKKIILDLKQCIEFNTPTNTEIVILSDVEQQIAIDNGCTLEVGLSLPVLTGSIPRKIAENLAKA